MLQQHDSYKQLMSQASQCTLQVLDRSWKSFFEAIKDWKVNPSKYLGRPKLPRYKDKDGRFPWFLKNNQTYIKEGKLFFRMKIFKGHGFKTSVKGRLIAVRFIPKGSIYVLEIVYEQEFSTQIKSSVNISSIDLGVNNFATIVNNIGTKPIIINGKGIKSINQLYNKQRAKMQSELKVRHNKNWSNKLDKLTLKRNNKVKNFIHHASKTVIDYCKNLGIDTLIIGLNKTWKQDSKMNDKTNQNFIQIPYDMFISQLHYKCEENNICLIINEESYTSGTSFPDNEEPIKENYNKNRREHRGLFKSNTGKHINSDVNGAFQIMKKVFPKVFADGIKGCLTPTIINVVKY
jgi:putative transposase